MCIHLVACVVLVCFQYISKTLGITYSWCIKRPLSIKYAPVYRYIHDIISTHFLSVCICVTEYHERESKQLCEQLCESNFESNFESNLRATVRATAGGQL